MTDIQPAQAELAALARAMRPDWDPDAFTAALVAAKTAGWPWLRAFNVAVRLLADPSAEPYDLKQAAASPLRREPGSPPPSAYQEARAAIQARQPEGKAS